MKIEITHKEVLRMMGMKLADADEGLLGEIDKIHSEIEEICRPKSIWKCVPLENEGCHFSFGGVSLDSHSLELNLKGCTHVIMLAVTLGLETDYYLKRTRMLSSAKGVISQSVAAEIVEQYCNRINDEIDAYAKENGFKTHTRYSPGYGDFPIELQEPFLQTLNASKEIGIKLTESYMMVPSKSITAIVGLEPLKGR